MLRYMKTGTMLLSIAYIVLGLMLLIVPERSLLMICYVFGAVVLITGIVGLVQYTRTRGQGFAAPFLLISGVITGALGVFTLLRPAVVASFLPVVFGLFIAVDGLNRISSGMTLAKRHAHRWWVLVLLGLLSIALGVFLVWRPFDVAVSVVMLCGILLIVEGAMNLSCVIYASMELNALERMAQSALNATLAAAGEALDAEEEAAQAIEDALEGKPPVVYNAESTELPNDDTKENDTL